MNNLLEEVMKTIRKEFGEMSIMRLGDQDVKDIPVILNTEYKSFIKQTTDTFGKVLYTTP